MTVYRITLAKWANQLTGSGYPARWNSKGKFVVYTAGSIALATLENLVHRSGEGLMLPFKLIVIKIPDSIAVSEIGLNKLHKDWHLTDNYTKCQLMGDDWLQKGSSIMKVPSAIISNEHNDLINPNHKDFTKIKIKKVTDFTFDPRLTK